MEETTAMLTAISVMKRNVSQLRERMKLAEGDLDLLDNAQGLFDSLQQEINFLSEHFDSKDAEVKLHNDIKNNVLQVLGDALKHAADKEFVSSTVTAPTNNVGKQTKTTLKDMLLAMAESIDDS